MRRCVRRHHHNTGINSLGHDGVDVSKDGLSACPVHRLSLLGSRSKNNDEKEMLASADTNFLSRVQHG